MAVEPNRVLHPVEVVGVGDLAPHMRRVTVSGEALRDLAVTRPGQWMKVFLPPAPGEKAHGRAYTIRRHDRAAGTMDLDFVLHGDGARRQPGPSGRRRVRSCPSRVPGRAMRWTRHGPTSC